MKKELLVFIFSAFVCASVVGQADAEYGKMLKKMFKVSNVEGTYQASMVQMFAMYRQQFPTVEQDVRNDFKKEFSKSSIEDLANKLILVYKKHLTIDDIEELITFYETPVVKKNAKKIKKYK